MEKESSRQAMSNYNNLEEKIRNNQKYFLKLQQERRDLMMSLEKVKSEELELLKQVTDIFVGSDQKDVVQALLEDSENQELQLRVLIDAIDREQTNKTTHSKKVLQEISAHLDELIQKKNDTK
jgi:hypothetical protein